jgi:hypothetical protein
MKRLHALIGMFVAACLGAAATLTAQTIFPAPDWYHVKPVQIGMMVAPPCGGWWPAYTHSVAPYVRHDEVWLLVHCEDGRLFSIEVPNVTVPDATTNGH